jgi:hypothetical protein
MLAGIDPGVQLLQHLVIPREQSTVEYLGVAQVHFGLHGLGADHDALTLCRELRERDVLFSRLAGQG